MTSVRTSSDIERLTRQKLVIQPLPADFINEANKIKSTRSPMPVSRDEQNGRNGRAMQHGRPGGGQRHGQGQGQRREGQPQGDNRRQGQPGERQGEQRQGGAPRGDRPAGDAPRNYARPKGKFHARPARPANAGGGRGR